MSILGLPSNHYRLPAQSCTLTAVPGDILSTSDAHVFISGTNCPYKSNEVHVIAYLEGTAEVKSLQILPFQDEIRALSCLDSIERDSTTLCYTAIASRDAHTPKRESCRLYSASVNSQKDENTDLQWICDIGSPTSYQPIRKILVDPHVEIGMDQKRLGIIHTDGFSLYQLSEEARLVAKKLTSNSSPDSICNSGCFDPHHINLFLTVESFSLSGWDLRMDSAVFHRPRAHPSAVLDVDYNPNMPNLVVTGGVEGSLRFWDIRQLEDPVQILSNVHSHWITCVRYNQCHDQLILTGGTDNIVKLHRVEMSANVSTPEESAGNEETQDTSSSLISTHDEHEDSVYEVIWSKNDSWCFASLSHDGRIAINHVPSSEKYSILL
ncbi:WD domain, G-beta repeat-containing protein [Cardiosporidium cionae]|uniref:WD domain, G-beta repeat-containing protein n=1 Tax=Cardiosporidium cionae TaxID=476202 RepID=A0ABQ7J706_9APIC|nr:WD domain, G-beta repeat-containing protein [Cardiosporidium cionae]|eukprot:KAF8819475.1 WD domain, G-beta repeat-containing protein [Cardiosporidium cionae]